MPVEDLAKRVTAVGTESRPLLGSTCGAYDQALSRLSKLLDDRGAAYANADARLSFQSELAFKSLPFLLEFNVVHTIQRYLSSLLYT